MRTRVRCSGIALDFRRRDQPVDMLSLVNVKGIACVQTVEESDANR